MSDAIEVILHSGLLSGAASLDCKFEGAVETKVFRVVQSAGPVIYGKVGIHCDDAASLRALAAICTRAADALDAPSMSEAAE